MGESFIAISLIALFFGTYCWGHESGKKEGKADEKRNNNQKEKKMQEALKKLTLKIASLTKKHRDAFNAALKTVVNLIKNPSWDRLEVKKAFDKFKSQLPPEIKKRCQMELNDMECYLGGK